MFLFENECAWILRAARAFAKGDYPEPAYVKSEGW